VADKAIDPVPIEFLEHDGVALAFRRSAGVGAEGGGAGLVWLGGFHSDMEGEKACALHAAADGEGRAFLRFDYTGHGASGGAFADGTIGRWRSDALAAIDRLTAGPLVLAGSSMGGWLALLCALARPERVKGLVLLAPAADFTERLMWARFGPEQRQAILDTGSWTRPSAYDPAGYPVTARLIEEGRDWLIMDGEIAFDGPVRILHGGCDEDVPWSHSFELVGRLRTPNVDWTLIKDGDHRLSRREDIAAMIAAALGMALAVDGISRTGAREARSG